MQRSSELSTVIDGGEYGRTKEGEKRFAFNTNWIWNKNYWLEDKEILPSIRCGKCGHNQFTIEMSHAIVSGLLLDSPMYRCSNCTFNAHILY